jgi:hypothetical protein
VFREYKYPIKESINLDPATNNKFVQELDINGEIRPGNNSISIYNNQYGTLEVACKGNMNFKKEGSKGDRTQKSEIKDFGLANNSAIVAISNFSEESMTVHIFPSKEGSPHKTYKLKETT